MSGKMPGRMSGKISGRMSGKISGGGGDIYKYRADNPRRFLLRLKSGANSRPGALRGQKNSLYRFAIKTNLSTRSFLWAEKPFLFDVVEFSNNSPCFFRRVYNFARLRFFRRNNPVRGQARDVHYRIPKFFAYQHYRNILFFACFYQG